MLQRIWNKDYEVRRWGCCWGCFCQLVASQGSKPFRQWGWSACFTLPLHPVAAAPAASPCMAFRPGFPDAAL